MRRQFLVIGAGRFGSAVARTLYDLGHDVVVVDNEEAELGSVMDQVTHAAVLDATDERALARLGLAEMDAVIVAIGDDLEASILATVAARTAGGRHIISKANDNQAARILATVGADEVVRPENDMGRRLAEQLSMPNQVAALELGADHSVVEIDVGPALCGVLSDLELPRHYGVQVLAVHRGGDVTVTPPADFVIEDEDRVVVLGENEALDRLRRHSEESK